MAKYRRIPEPVEAVQWDGTEECVFKIIPLYDNHKASSVMVEGNEIRIMTKFGPKWAKIGYWIIKGVDWAYPDVVRAPAFEATYEEVEQPQPPTCETHGTENCKHCGA